MMHVNNEIGTIQPIGEVGKYLKGLKEKFISMLMLFSHMEKLILDHLNTI